MSPWLTDLNGNSWMSRLVLKDTVFENTPSLAWKQHKTEKQRSDLRCCPQQHPESRLPPRKSFPVEASMAMTKDRQSQQQKTATSKEVSKAEALWLTSRKSDQTRICSILQPDPPDGTRG